MNNKIPILFSFRRCPYAIRARIAIKLCGLECEIREISLKLKSKEFSFVHFNPGMYKPRGEMVLFSKKKETPDTSLSTSHAV